MSNLIISKLCGHLPGLRLLVMELSFKSSLVLVAQTLLQEVMKREAFGGEPLVSSAVPIFSRDGHGLISVEHVLVRKSKLSPIV